jgi:hypothetical protein
MQFIYFFVFLDHCTRSSLCSTSRMGFMLLLCGKTLTFFIFLLFGIWWRSPCNPFIKWHVCILWLVIPCSPFANGNWVCLSFYEMCVICWVLNAYNGKMKNLFRIVWLFKGMCVHLFVSLNVSLCLCLWGAVYVFKGLFIYLFMSLEVCCLFIYQCLFNFEGFRIGVYRIQGVFMFLRSMRFKVNKCLNN